MCRCVPLKLRRSRATTSSTGHGKYTAEPRGALNCVSDARVLSPAGSKGSKRPAAQVSGHGYEQVQLLCTTAPSFAISSSLQAWKVLRQL